MGFLNMVFGVWPHRFFPYPEAPASVDDGIVELIEITEIIPSPALGEEEIAAIPSET